MLVERKAEDLEHQKASSAFLLHFPFPGTAVEPFLGEMAHVGKGDLGFGLGPATSSPCTLQTMILCCGAQPSHLRMMRCSGQPGDLLVLMVWASLAGEGSMTRAGNPEVWWDTHWGALSHHSL